jgi:hypothetical protein
MNRLTPVRISIRSAGSLVSRSPSQNGFLVGILVLACFAITPRVQAVYPPPDGGYPNNNTAEGTGALFNLTTGSENTATGYRALYSNTTGSQNTATGYLALL